MINPNKPNYVAYLFHNGKNVGRCTQILKGNIKLSFDVSEYTTQYLKIDGKSWLK